MKLIDFEYDGMLASKMGLMPCSFDSSDDTVNMGNNLTMNPVKAAKADTYYSPYSGFTEAYMIELDVCNYYCNNNVPDPIDAERIVSIMRWLNRRQYLKFKPIYDDGSFSDVYYMVTFNLTGVYGGNEIMGFNLTGETNAPYGFKEESYYISSGSKLDVSDRSDQIGYIYPDFIVEVSQAGDLEITNSADPEHVFIIKNCKSGEKITVDGKHKQIKTNMASHDKFYNDFNYKFLRIVNTIDNNNNQISANLNCKITLWYNPIAKTGVII